MSGRNEQINDIPFCPSCDIGWNGCWLIVAPTNSVLQSGVINNYRYARKYKYPVLNLPRSAGKRELLDGEYSLKCSSCDKEMPRELFVRTLVFIRHLIEDNVTERM